MYKNVKLNLKNITKFEKLFYKPRKSKYSKL